MERLGCRPENPHELSEVRAESGRDQVPNVHTVQRVFVGSNHWQTQLEQRWVRTPSSPPLESHNSICESQRGPKPTPLIRSDKPPTVCPSALFQRELAIGHGKVAPKAHPNSSECANLSNTNGLFNVALELIDIMPLFPYESLESRIMPEGNGSLILVATREGAFD